MKLKELFAARGYKIVEKENLTDKEIASAIEEVVSNSKEFDSLVVCILSHGEEGRRESKAEFFFTFVFQG